MILAQFRWAGELNRWVRSKRGGSAGEGPGRQACLTVSKSSLLYALSSLTRLPLSLQETHELQACASGRTLCTCLGF